MSHTMTWLTATAPGTCRETRVRPGESEGAGTGEGSSQTHRRGPRTVVMAHVTDDKAEARVGRQQGTLAGVSAEESGTGGVQLQVWAT